MADKTTFIKLDRNIINWRWFKDHNTFKLFTYCLLMANTTDQPWRDIIIKRGQFVTSYAHIADDTGLTLQQVRTSLKHLKSTQELTYQSSPQYTVVTIKNYDKYQSATYFATNKQHTANKRPTNDQQQYNNDNNDNKEKNIGGGAPEWAPPAKGTPEYDAWRNQ